MTTGLGATGARKQLAGTVKRLRSERCLSIDEVRHAMQWSLSKLMRIEAGVVSLSANDLKSLLRFYDVHDDATLTALGDLARISRQRHWAASYREHLPQGYMDVLGYEDSAQIVRVFHPYLVPQLVQTADYARTVVAGTPGHPNTPDAINAHVQARMARQDRLLTRTDPVEVIVVVDEAALRRAVGGRDVMRGQVEHLRAVSSAGNVRVGIIPLSVHPAMTYPFALMQFSDAPALAYCEQAFGNHTLLDDPADVDMYQTAFGRLADWALPDTDAADCLAALQTRYAPTVEPAG